MAQTRPSKRRRLDPDPDRFAPDLPPSVQAALLLAAPQIQDAQQASQPYTTRSKSKQGQDRPSKRRRLNPDATSPESRPVTSSSVVFPTNQFRAVNSHVRKHEEKARLPPPANSFEGLPHELQLMIFNFLIDLDTFDALVNASPVHRRILACCPIDRALSRATIKYRMAEHKYMMICEELDLALEKERARWANSGVSVCKQANRKHGEGH